MLLVLSSILYRSFATEGLFQNRLNFMNGSIIYYRKAVINLFFGVPFGILSVIHAGSFPVGGWSKLSEISKMS